MCVDEKSLQLLSHSRAAVADEARHAGRDKTTSTFAAAPAICSWPSTPVPATHRRGHRAPGKTDFVAFRAT